MTIDQAIEIKSKYQYIPQFPSSPQLLEADSLSIEALKRIKECRLADHTIADYYLPGETKN